MKLFNRKICLSSPQRSDIVIFDETNSHYITDFILDGTPYFTYGMRPETIYISFSIVLNFFKSLININWKYLKTKSKLRLSICDMQNFYRFGCFLFINPKVVITFIDNSGGFHWLAENYRSAQFFAIQNGNRTIDQLERTHQYHQHFFCYGNYEKDLYTRLGYTIENHYPIGSIVADYFNHKVKNDLLNSSNYDLCVVSVQPVHNEKQFNTMKLMDTFISRYIKDYKIRAAILMRTNTDFNNYPHYYNAGFENEKMYYESLYGNEVELIEYNRESMSTYKGMANSKIVVGFLSTAIREAFGWGKKILYCDFTADYKYTSYNQMIVFTNPNYGDFKKRINKILQEPCDEYRKRTKKYASYLMNNDPSCPPHKYIKNKIEEYL